jgi:phosphatidylglycerophosphate synthase
MLRKQPDTPESAVLLTLTNAADIATARQFLLAKCRKCIGSGIDRYWFDLPSTIVAGWLSWLPVSPNFYTLVGFLISIVAGFSFAHATSFSIILGGLLVHIGYFFDCLDGRIARLKGQSSQLGWLLDSILDVVAIYFWFIGITIALYLRYGSVFALLGLFTIVGYSVSFLLQESLRDKTTGSTQISQKAPPKKNIMLQAITLFDWITNNDIMLYLILIFSFLNHLNILIIVLVILANLKWLEVIALNVYKLTRQPSTS